MEVTDIVLKAITSIAKRENIKEDDVSWHKIAIELAYMYKEKTKPFSYLDDIMDKDAKEKYVKMLITPVFKDYENN